MLVLNVLKVVRRLMMGTDFFLTMEQISYSDSQSNLSLHIGQIREWIKGSLKIQISKHFSGSSYSIRVMKDAKKFNKEPDLAASRVSTLLCIFVSTTSVYNTSALPKLIAQLCQLVIKVVLSPEFQSEFSLFMFTLICPLAMLGSSLKELWVPPNQQT